jgi:hypothetical protein
MYLPSWFTGSVSLIALGILLLTLPATFEGPLFLDIAEGHALSLLDTLALLPLIAGSTLLQWSIFKRRALFFEHMGARPGQASSLLFFGGLGLGLLLASAFSSFYWWWAIGAVIFAAAVLYAGILASKEKGEQVS